MVIWYLLHFLLSQLICQLSSSVGKNNSRRSLPKKSDIQDLIGDVKFVHVCRYNKVGSSIVALPRRERRQNVNWFRGSGPCSVSPAHAANVGISPGTKPRSGHLVRDPLALKTSSGAVYLDSSHCNVHEFLPKHSQI